MNTYSIFLKWSMLLLFFATLSSCSKQELPAQVSEKEALLQQFKDLYQDFRAVKLGPLYGTKAERDNLSARSKTQGEIYLSKVEDALQKHSEEGGLTAEDAQQIREDLKKEIFDEGVLAYRAYNEKRVEPLTLVLDQIYTMTNGELGEYYPSLKGMPATECYEWLVAQGVIEDVKERKERVIKE